MNFERDYPSAKIVKLEQNYRSTKKILAASNEIIALNRNQKPKKLWTDNDEGQKLIVYEALNEKDEARWIGKKIQQLQQEGVSTNDVVVLYRTNAQSRSLEEGFLRLGINYQVIGGVKFYNRKEIKDILAYLKIIFNPKDSISLLRVINTPRRKIGPKKLASAMDKSNLGGMSLLPYLLINIKDGEFDSGMVDFAQLMEKLISSSNNSKLTDLIQETINKSGYYNMLNDGTSENEARIENIKELLSVATKYDDLEPRSALETFLNEVALIEEQANQNDASSEKVTLMTIHAAKGLEFDYVFISGMEEGIFPHSRAYLDPAELEEERRLAYVAITRAKTQLFLSYAESRTYFGNNNSNPVSRFITDIPEDLIFIDTSSDTDKGWVSVSSFSDSEGENSFVPKFKNPKLASGDIVKHPVFGVGQVIECDDSLVVIDFAGGKRKELSLEYAQLEKI